MPTKKLKVEDILPPLLDTLAAQAACRPPTGFRPSSHWSQAGPLIEEARITLRYWSNQSFVTAYVEEGEWYQGPTPLIAAMRAYVALRMGDKITPST
jgi:hypothetical protein